MAVTGPINGLGVNGTVVSLDRSTWTLRDGRNIDAGDAATFRQNLGLSGTQQVFTSSFDGVPGNNGYVSNVPIAYRATKPGADVGADFLFVRNANNVGGVYGYVDSTIYADRAVTGDGTGKNFHWTATLVNHNSDPSPFAENSALCAQMRVQVVNASPSWAAVSELIDEGGENNPTRNRITHEFDWRGNGGDSGLSRCVIDVAPSQYVRTVGAAPLTVGTGINIGRSDGSEGDVTVTRGLNVAGKFDMALRFDLVSANYGVRFQGAATRGISLADATFTESAIVLGRGQKVALESTQTISSTMNTSGGIYRWQSGTTEYFGLDFDNTQLRVGQTNVVGARKTGWSADTGTVKRTANATYSATAEATYTQATIQALMDKLRDATQTIKALKDDLIAHGLIGT